MKKLLCLLITAIMISNVTVFAASYASINKIKTVRNDVEPSDQYLKITPLNEVETGSSIVISFTNAKVVEQGQIDGVYQYSRYSWSGEGFWDVVPRFKTNSMPYRIKKIGKNQIQVYLINIPGNCANRSLVSINGVNARPEYDIRLPFVTDGAGTMQIKIDNNDSSISSANLSGYYVFDSKYANGREKVLNLFTDTEGIDGNIIEPTTIETTTEATTEAPTYIYEEEASEETTETDIFDMEYTDLIAVRDVGDIITAGDELSYVDWDSVTKTVTISYKDVIVKFICNAPYYILNDEEVPFENEQLRAIIINRRMYVPVGIIIDTLGLEPVTEESTTEATTSEETTKDAAEGTTEISSEEVSSEDVSEN